MAYVLCIVRKAGEHKTPVRQVDTHVAAQFTQTYRHNYAHRENDEPSIFYSARRICYTKIMAKPGNYSEKESNNLAIGIGVGLPVGAVLGFTVFDNVATGAGIGLVLGVAISVAFNEKRKKQP